MSKAALWFAHLITQNVMFFNMLPLSFTRKIAYGFLLLSVLPACNKSEAPAGAPAGASKSGYQVNAVEGYLVKPVVLDQRVAASGALLPAEETELHPEASGRVVFLHLPEGKTVKQGELLVKIFDEDLKTQKIKLETQLRQAEITEQRLSELLKVRGVSQQEYDLAALAVQNIKNEIELARIQISKTELRAPYTGVLGLRHISPGAYITPATAVATIRSASGLKLDFSIPERYSAFMRPGQNVEFTVEGQSRTFTATVQATEQRISESSRELLVRAQVNRPDPALLPGMFAEAALVLGRKTEAMMIPSQAIVPQAREKKVFVSRNGKAASVVVKTGVRQADKVEITEGLQPGDTVAVTGMLFLRPDAPLKFSKID